MIAITYFQKPSRNILMARIKMAGIPITDMSTGIKVTGKNFNFNTRRFPTDQLDLNKKLNQFETHIYERHTLATKVYGENIPKELLVQAIKNKNSEITESIRSTDLTLSWMSDEYSRRLKSGMVFNVKTGMPLAKASIKTLVESCLLFNKFIGLGNDFNFTKFNLATTHVLGKAAVQHHYDVFINSFKRWLLDRNMSEYTVYKTIYKMKQMIRYFADAEGLEIGGLIRNLKFRKPHVEVEVISSAQISFFINNYERIVVDCTTPEQRNTVDYIVVGLLMSARRGDMNSWTRDNLYEEDGTTFIRYRPEKTANSSGVTVNVPVPDLALRIFNQNILKHGGRLLPALSQSINKRIKAIAQRYDIFHNEVQVYRKGKYIKTKLYNTLHIHQMRASSTSDKLMSMPEAVVREWTGHVHDSEAFSRYVHVSQKAKKEFASDYFNKLNNKLKAS